MAHSARRSACVLIVDDEPTVREALADALRADRLRVHEAATLSEARARLRIGAIDLVLLDASLPDGDGLDLADELGGGESGVESIVITGDANTARAVKALRAGACDLLAKPVNLSELTRSVERALERGARRRRLAGRVARLREICRRLRESRNQTNAQADALCQDMAQSYHQLAGQVKHVRLTERFRSTIEHELDLEELLRRALEFVLQHLGPTNAAIFLPGGETGFSVGGYINYSYDRETTELLLDHLADTAAPRIGEARATLHLTNRSNIRRALGLDIDNALLDGSHVVGVAARHKEDVLASLLFFRDAAEPYDREAVEALGPISAAFAAQLVKVIGIHHRREPDPVDMDDFDADCV